jgi:CHAD domain-containing protein
MSYAIEPGEGVDEALRRITGEQLEKALAACEEELHHGIHEVRKRCKKIRALLRLVRKAEPDLYREKNDRLRDLARTLSDCRDAQANIEVIDERGDSLDPALRSLLREASIERRDQRVGQQDGHGRLDRVRTALAVTLEDLGAWSVDATGWAALEGGLQKTYRRARHRWLELGDDPSMEALHEWRKRCKYHRHHVDLLRRAFPGPLEAREDALHDLTDLLGDDQDCVRLARVTAQEELLDDDGIDAVRAWADDLHAETLEDVRALGEKLFVEKPKVLAERFEAAWSA